jgi:hypothetical protein
LVARNAFADLFLRDELGHIYCLDVAVGTLTKVADSDAEFIELAKTQEKREKWFAGSDEHAFAARGLKPNANQCIGFSVPLVFAVSGSPNSPYVADIYDHVGFLGDLHKQIPTFPEGTQVRLKVKH